MKQRLVVAIMLCVFGLISAMAQSNDEYKVAKTANGVVATQQADVSDDGEGGIEAFSDTTSTDNGDTDYAGSDEDMVSTNVSHDPSDYNSISSWLESFMNVSLGFGGILIAIICILLVFLLMLSPFIILILILRFLVRRHNDRIELAEKAMETGAYIPEDLMPIDKKSNDYLRRQGIRNIWIGIGSICMFGIWGAEMLEGIGALILCYGIGQIVIARSERKKDDI